MKTFDGRYRGASLQAFVLGLAQSQPLIEKILRDHGLDRVDPDRWYDLNTARSIYYSIGKQVGPRSLKAVGMKIIETAPFPPEVKDARSALSSLNAAYGMNVQGPEVGYLSTTFDDDSSASVISATPFPCALSEGVIQGCCKKFGERVLVEHAPGTCVDRGDPSCTFRISW